MFSPPIEYHNVSTALPIGAISIVKINITQTKARVLYDQGSQRTLISQSLINKFNLKPGSTIQLQLSGFISEIERKEYQIVKFYS